MLNIMFIIKKIRDHRNFRRARQDRLRRMWVELQNVPPIVTVEVEAEPQEWPMNKKPPDLFLISYPTDENMDEKSPNVSIATIQQGQHIVLPTNTNTQLHPPLNGSDSASSFNL